MGIEAFGVMPCHVVGPLLCRDHQRPWMWQTRIGDMLEGYGHPRMMWNIVDVRDVAEAQRLIAECKVNHNGERYCLVATDEGGLKTQEEVQAVLKQHYPGYAIAGSRSQGRTFRSPVCFLEKCVTQLHMTPHTPEEALIDNADSLIAMGLVTPRKGEDNWQTKAKDLGIKSKWSPGLYPAMDPETKQKILAKIQKQSKL